MTDIPCKQCIALAMCISKKRIKCDILWDYYQKVEYEQPELIVFYKICEILPNMDALDGPDKYNEYKWYVHAREKMRNELNKKRG